MTAANQQQTNKWCFCDGNIRKSSENIFFESEMCVSSVCRYIISMRIAYHIPRIIYNMITNKNIASVNFVRKKTLSRESQKAIEIVSGKTE